MTRNYIFLISAFIILGQHLCLASTQLEWIDIDSSSLKTKYDAYGLPSVTFTKDFYPVIEYKFDGSFIDTVLPNFFVKNREKTGPVNVKVTIETEKSVNFTLKAGTAYVIRVPIKLLNTASWGKGIGKTYPVNIKIGNLEKNISFKGEHSDSIEFDIILEEMPSKIDSGNDENLPNENWFYNSIWSQKYFRSKYSLGYIKLLPDRTFQYNDSKPNNFKECSRDCTWEIKKGDLIISWNNGYSVYKYKIAINEFKSFYGTNNRDNYPRELKRIGE